MVSLGEVMSKEDFDNYVKKLNGKCPKCGSKIKTGILNDIGGKKANRVFCLGDKDDKCNFRHAIQESISKHKNISCTKCGERIYFDPKGEGKTIECPECGTSNKNTFFKESLDEAKSTHAYEEGKNFGKKWNHKDKVVNPYEGGANEKPWKDGFEDGAYPSEARRKNPYKNESNIIKCLNILEGIEGE
jgi:DNA-directed RNA polymerase subunit RPC12/RpoP